LNAPLETKRQRWVRLYRRIMAAGRVPAKTLEGCELQVRLLDSGEFQPLPAPSKAVRRVMASDAARHGAYDRDALECDDAEQAFDALDRAERERLDREHEFEPPEFALRESLVAGGES
jgi:hypothetical protein